MSEHGRGIVIVTAENYWYGKKLKQAIILKPDEIDLNNQAEFSSVSRKLVARARAESKFIHKLGRGKIPEGIELK